MPKETAEEHVNDLMLQSVREAMIRKVRARDREVKEEVRAAASAAIEACSIRAYNGHNVSWGEIKSAISALPLDPPAEDQVCGTCGKYFNETFMVPCPDCHGTERQRAQELGRCDVHLWPERHDSGLHVGEHEFIPLSCANWRPVGRQRAQGKEETQ